MDYNTRQKELVKLELKAKQKAVDLTDAVIAIIPKFAGKAPSKRLDTALKVIDPNLQFEMEYNSFKIRLYISNRSFSDGEHTYYIHDPYVYLIHACIRSGYGDGIVQNGTIDGDLLIKLLQGFKTQTQDNIQYIEQQLEDLEYILQGYNNIKKLQTEFINGVSYMIRNYFDLKF